MTNQKKRRWFLDVIPLIPSVSNGRSRPPARSTALLMEIVCASRNPTRVPRSRHRFRIAPRVAGSGGLAVGQFSAEAARRARGSQPNRWAAAR